VQFKRILEYIRSGIDSGATLESGGESVGPKGYYIQPTVFSNVQVSVLPTFNKKDYMHTYVVMQFKPLFQTG
jgi:hypothetical protein